MPPFQKLAKHLVTEIPVAQLQVILRRPPREDSLPPYSGTLCGGGCGARPGLNGTLCGLGCTPKAASAPGVIDREGRLGLTAKDLTDIRKDFPKLRQAVARQLEAHLGKLR